MTFCFPYMMYVVYKFAKIVIHFSGERDGI